MESYDGSFYFAGGERLFSLIIKEKLLGKTLATSELDEQRITKKVALAVFSSDALSSVAYATEEIVLVLILAGSKVLGLSVPIAFAIVALLAILSISYRQVISAYPGGGGSYIVATENLGHEAGLAAGASILIDYILTVAVSISAGVAAITSALPALAPDKVSLAIGFIILIAFFNLRGTKESGKIFSIPTYGFILSIMALILMGFVKIALGYHFNVPVPKEQVVITQSLTLFLILRAFASGCTALTGVEAISNGVQSFKKPSAKNARTTLTAMVLILSSMFIGITLLVKMLGVLPSESETIISQLAHVIFGNGFFYYGIQTATAAILVLAANTSFADFPRVASIMAQDGYMPKQLRDRGSRLAYSNGIIALSAFAVFLIVLFKGDTHALIPLYAVGVFMSFTLSQAGMVKHWQKSDDPGRQRKAIINGLGAVTTFIVFIILTVTKFIHGAWMVIALIPPLIWIFKKIKNHYDSLYKKISIDNLLDGDKKCFILPESRKRTVVVLIGSPYTRADVEAVREARLLVTGNFHVVHVATDKAEAEELYDEWNKYETGVPLEIVPSPYRILTSAVIERLKEIEEERDDDQIYVVIPEIVSLSFWAQLLHHQTALVLKLRLLFWKRVVVISYPIYPFLEQ